DDILLGMPCRQGEMFADLYSRDISGDRFELAADLRRRTRLEVPGILLPGPAAHEQENTRLGLIRRVGLIRPRGAGAEQVRQDEPRSSQATDLEKVAARNAVAQTVFGTRKTQHEFISKIDLRPCAKVKARQEAKSFSAR